MAPSQLALLAGLNTPRTIYPAAAVNAELRAIKSGVKKVAVKKTRIVRVRLKRSKYLTNQLTAVAKATAVSLSLPTR